MLRRSELTELAWQNIDLKSGRVIVERTKTIKNFTLVIPKQLISAWQLLPANFFTINSSLTTENSEMFLSGVIGFPENKTYFAIIKISPSEFSCSMLI